MVKSGHLEEKSFEFVNSGIGLVLDPAAQALMEDSSIPSCNMEINTCEDASNLRQTCYVSGCSDYSINVGKMEQSSKEMGSRQMGPFLC